MLITDIHGCTGGHTERALLQETIIFIMNNLVQILETQRLSYSKYPNKAADTRTHLTTALLTEGVDELAEITGLLDII